MKKLLVVGLTFLSVVGLEAQYKRPNAEIATELDRVAADSARLAAELRLPDAPPVTRENLQQALNSAAPGSTLTLEGTFTGNYTTNGVSIRGGRLITPNNQPALIVAGDGVRVEATYIGSLVGAVTNDLVIYRGTNATFANVEIEGNGSTKRGIADVGINLTLDPVHIHHVGRRGQESQAVAKWDGTGLTIRNSVLAAGSTPVLIGGNDPAVPNTIPADILIEDSVLTHHVEWRGQGYVNKTGFELKSARRVIFRRNVVEHVWADGQTAFAFTFTPVNQGGNSPLTIVEDVLIEDNEIRNVGGGANILGLTQETARPTLRLQNVTFRNNRFTISRATQGGHGSLMQLGKGPLNLNWDGNTVVQDNEAFIRTSDSAAIEGFQFVNNNVTTNVSVVANIYGIWTPIGSRGGAWVATVFPGIILVDNTFTGWHSVFRNYFTQNTYQ